MGGRGRGGGVERERERRILMGWKEERRKGGLKGGREGEREAATCTINSFPSSSSPAGSWSHICCGC